MSSCLRLLALGAAMFLSLTSCSGSRSAQSASGLGAGSTPTTNVAGITQTEPAALAACNAVGPALAAISQPATSGGSSGSVYLPDSQQQAYLDHIADLLKTSSIAPKNFETGLRETYTINGRVVVLKAIRNWCQALAAN